MGKEKTTGKGPNKIAALITYVIALVCLLLGLFLPFGNGGADTVSNMLGLQLPAAINAIHPFEFLKATAEKYPFAYSFPVSFGDKFKLDFGAVLVLLYALVTLMGVVALIPAIVNAASKKSKKNIALNAASFIEILAVAVLSCLMFFILSAALTSADGVKAINNWSLLAAFGGTLLVLVLQAFIYKKGSGVIKFVLALISAVAVFVTLFDITKALPFLADKLPTVGSLEYSLYGNGNAIDHVALLFAGFIRFDLGYDAKTITLLLMGVSIFYIVCANFVFDAMGLGKKTNKAMLIANVIRYALELAVAAVIIIVSAITDGVAIGILSILIAVLALIALIINIIRLATYKSAKKAKKAKTVKESAAPAVAAETAEEPAKETKKERKQREKAEKLAAKQAQKEAEEAEKQAAKAQKAAEAENAKASAAAAAAVAPVAQAEEQPVNSSEDDLDNPAFYRPVIYKGPVDDFIRLLNNEQKVEFAKVFIERQNGPLSGVPDYVIGGDNAKFFSAVFIYFAKIRDLISDGLMNELYKQANVMR